MSVAAPSPSGGHRITATLLLAERRHRGGPAGGRSPGRLRLGAAAVPVQRAGRVGRRRRPRPDGRIELLRRRQRAGAKRKSRRGVLHRHAAVADPPRGRCHGGAAGDDHFRLCRVQRHQDGLADDRANLGLRPAAGMDVLSDGRRRAVHDGVRAGAFLHASRPRHDRRHRCDRRDRRPLSGMGFPQSGFGAVVGNADAGGLLHHAVRRIADRLCAGAGGADLHLGGRHAARRHLRAADGARHRQFRAARDPLLHPGRLSHGSQRHVGPPDRTAAARGGADARRAERRHGDVDGAVLGHLRLQDGRRRRRRLGTDSGRAPLAAESGQRGGAVGRLRRDGGNHSAVHQFDHPRFRRQSVDRRLVRRGLAAGRIDGTGADRAVHHPRKEARTGCGGRAANSGLRACGAARSPRSG